MSTSPFLLWPLGSISLSFHHFFACSQAAEFSDIPPFCPLCRTDFRASDMMHDEALDAKLLNAYPAAYSVREQVRAYVRACVLTVVVQ